MKVMLTRGRQTAQIEFPEGIKRHPSHKEGSLHLARNKVTSLTEEEFDFIDMHRPEVSECLEILPSPTISGRAKRLLKAAEEKAKADAKADAKTESDNGKSKSSSSSKSKSSSSSKSKSSSSSKSKSSSSSKGS